jgi:GT2 family glycosyltransferase
VPAGGPATAQPTVAAVILAHNRRDAVAIVLDRLASLPLVEIFVVDNGSTDGTAELVRERGGSVRLLDPGRNTGIAGRNLAAREATADLLLMLDDDSYPGDGALETLVAAFVAAPQLAVAGGRVREVDSRDGRGLEQGLGTFDWWLGSGERPAGATGVPAFFFPEGASLVRRSMFLEVGGFFEPYFLACSELDLTTRLVGAGWDVRYFPEAVFEHMKAEYRVAGVERDFYYRVRNHLWYLWLRFPARLAATRTVGYLAFDLVDALHRGVPGAWARGVADAWRLRRLVRGERRPLPRDVLRRAELDRGRKHVELLAAHGKRRLRRVIGR